MLTTSLAPSLQLGLQPMSNFIPNGFPSFMPAPITYIPNPLLAGSVNAYEGAPIFLVPPGANGGPSTVSLAALQRVHEMRINWARQPTPNQPRIDTSRHFHVFVGDLSPEVDNKMLIEAFAVYGEVSDGKVIRDMITLKSKGYGFLSFIKREEAEKAIESMNGQSLGKRVIRTNWAARKPNQPFTSQLEGASFDEVFNATTPTNCSVYVGNITPETSDDDLRAAFAQYGTIEDIRLLATLGYAFIRFETKENATQAICEMNGQELNGQIMRCSWGKPNYEVASSGSTSSTGSMQNLSPHLAAVNNAMLLPAATAAAAQQIAAVAAAQAATTSNATNFQALQLQHQHQHQQQQYFNNIYQQYYNNPQMLAQWQRL